MAGRRTSKSSFPLVDRLIGGTLADFLAQRRAAGISYDAIAREIHQVHGLDFTGETIRRWCSEMGIPKPEKASA